MASPIHDLVSYEVNLLHLFRIWWFSDKNVYIVSFLIAAALASFAMGILNSVDFSKNLLLTVAVHFESHVISMYSVGAGGESMLIGSSRGGLI